MRVTSSASCLHYAWLLPKGRIHEKRHCLQCLASIYFLGLRHPNSVFQTADGLLPSCSMATIHGQPFGGASEKGYIYYKGYADFKSTCPLPRVHRFLKNDNCNNLKSFNVTCSRRGMYWLNLSQFERRVKISAFDPPSQRSERPASRFPQPTTFWT